MCSIHSSKNVEVYQSHGKESSDIVDCYNLQIQNTTYVSQIGIISNTSMNSKWTFLHKYYD